ncbi:MAG: CYTH domain-containing protein [Clostridium sp.]|nr:CYTH domain-containing protein [Clostridium sp.]
MALEIERKFLVANESYRQTATSRIDIWQGYISTDPQATARLRIANDKAFLTIKGKNRGATRGEWEYPIPLNEAIEMKPLCKASLEKTRYIVPHEGHVWEVDEFRGRHKGLTVAEIELKTENEAFSIPPFIGEEVTGDPKYYNSNLSAV